VFYGRPGRLWSRSCGNLGFWSITGNPIETYLSGASLLFTALADRSENGSFGEATNTSFVTFLAGGAIGDPIGDLIVDGYSSGYNHGVFNGIDSLMDGDPFIK